MYQTNKIMYGLNTKSYFYMNFSCIQYLKVVFPICPLSSKIMHYTYMINAESPMLVSGQFLFQCKVCHRTRFAATQHYCGPASVASTSYHRGSAQDQLFRISFRNRLQFCLHQSKFCQICRKTGLSAVAIPLLGF